MMNIYHVYEDPINNGGSGCHQRFVRSIMEAKQFIKENEDGKYRLHNVDHETGKWIYEGYRLVEQERDYDRGDIGKHEIRWFIERKLLHSGKSGVIEALNEWPLVEDTYQLL